MSRVQSTSCDNCRSLSYLGPNTRQYTAPCSHRFCHNCVNLFFKHGVTRAKCPVCKVEFGRGQLTTSVYALGDPRLHREARKRKELSAFFALKPEDFESIYDYNEHLERMEDYIMNFVYEYQVKETQDALDQYEQQYRERLAKRKVEQDNLMRIRQEAIHREKMIKQEKNREYFDSELSRLIEHQQKKEEVELALSKGKILPTSIKEPDNSALWINGPNEVVQEQNEESQPANPSNRVTLRNYPAPVPNPIDETIRETNIRAYEQFYKGLQLSGEPLTQEMISDNKKACGADDESSTIRDTTEYFSSVRFQKKRAMAKRMRETPT
ncbi:putative RNA polymerase II transcription factor B subunit 3 [Blattamonas nauphoetae]|uniref:RNA polymerase II transcription factor B subunit 3 n=1 Tax=Blattamonas nauphoetae TaxID=2049346 RepID=A0ABQ9Y4P2_9EUKA|nr:putative RNA polymerase II transcription factor B subunit 3 [Blattamonas nauphoetae]